MSFVPQNLQQLCVNNPNSTSCSASSVIFLQLITSLFGYSQDSLPNLQRRDGLNEEIEFRQNEEVDGVSYDFIVVGAGSAGCVVANRLTEVQDWNVLLLEAGGEEPELADVPAFAPYLPRSSIDWDYRTQPSPHSCLARPDGQCSWTRGKVMGGSSTINYMFYMRGGAEDYDEWASMGNPGWSYQEILPYFIKSENNKNPDLVEPGYHGQGGYLNVEVHRYQDKNVFPIIDGFRELGLPETDPNGEQQLGVTFAQATVRDGQRQSTNVAFIRPIRNKRSNLFVKTQSKVARILINPETKTAYGVEYLSNGKFYRVYAKREVILSAGSINSPQILMVSGVGPASQLTSLGISPIVDLPVGENLQDHTTIDGVIFSVSKTSTLVDHQTRLNELFLYKQAHLGPLSAPGATQISAMIQTKYETSKRRPDIQYVCGGVSLQELLPDPARAIRVIPVSTYDGLAVNPVLLNPESRGSIKLNETDPVFGKPYIFANTFTEEIDVLRMLEGIKYVVRLVETESLKKVGIELVSLPLPACRNFEFGSDEYWVCVMMAYTTTICHPVGTCKMGPKEDPTSVVDSELRVHGINNLRVIDSSIMPKIVRGNTNAPTIMIAERGSDFIKEKWLGSHGDVQQDHVQTFFL